MRRAPANPTRRPISLGGALLLGISLGMGAGGVAACDSGGGTDAPDLGTELRGVSPSGLRAPAGTVLPQGPTVEVVGEAGEAISGAEVRFRVVAGGGSAAPSRTRTDAEGRARAIWVLGPEAGSEQVLRARISGDSVRITATAVEPAPGQRVEGRRGHTLWTVGRLPLVLSAPHGGRLRPEEIPDRTSGVTVRDRRTLELTGAIADAVAERTGARPHVVVSLLDRIKVDPNRPLPDATRGAFEGDRAWWEYHTFLEAARARIEAAHGAGLLLDIHGHAHEIPRVELGYLLGPSRLALSDAELASRRLADSASIRDLAERSPHSFPELLRGDLGLGGLLELRGVRVVPGPTEPDPGGAPYFSGGYITRRHGSRGGDEVSAIQLEHHWPGLRDTQENRTGYARLLADALLEYFQAHLGHPLEAEGS